jgi:hypothetical protein
MKSMLLCAAALLTGSATAANALTYVVDGSIGGGSVSGTISTNGAIGTLAASDITGWSLVVTGNGGASATLDTLNSSVFLGGGAVTADASNIYFDFTKNNAAPSYLLFQQSFQSGSAYVCAANADYALTPCYYGASAVPENFASASAAYSVPNGNLVVASIAAVPEPATWAMMIGGLAIVGASLRRRSVAVRFV